MATTTTKPEPTPVKKRNDAYTGFLAISFLSMVGGCVLLYLDYQNYENKNPPKGPNIDVPGAVLKNIPGSAPPAPKIAEPKTDDTGDKKDGKDMGMGRPPADSVPPLLPSAVVSEPIKPVEPVQSVQAVESPLPSLEPVVEIPLAPLPTVGEQVQPAKVPDVLPIIPNAEPDASDAPPLPQQQFTPPK
jgi:hypothetical protein